MILIYSDIKTSRLIYILDFCFTSKGLFYEITNSAQDFESFGGMKINYSDKPFNSSLTVVPEGLIFEEDIRTELNLHFDVSKNSWTLTKVQDYFSIIFCFLTCYDEYLIKSADEHDRVKAEDSLLVKNKRLQVPNADLIIKDIWTQLNIDYSGIKKQFKSIITFDIDSAWAVKNKGIIRSILGDLKLIFKGQSTSERNKIRNNEIKDPFDTFSKIKELSNSHKVICFFLMSDWGKYDKNIHWTNSDFQSLIKSLKGRLDIGIHPSYQSYLNPKKIEKELNRLKKVVSLDIKKSRQHFLKLKLPETYESLKKIGIKEDYSMGFADDFGFRSGTCFPYYFFNLKTNTLSHIQIHPITYMDSTLNKYLKLSPEESINIIQKLKKEVKNVGGEFIPLWHNETIGDSGIWKGWLKVFESNFSG